MKTRQERLEARVLFWRSLARLALEAVGELRQEREWLHDRLDKQGQRDFRRRVRKQVPVIYGSPLMKQEHEDGRATRWDRWI